MGTGERALEQPRSARQSFAWLRPRFSLRWLLVAMFLLAVLFGVYARLKARAERQKEILAQTAVAGGYVRYDFECWSESRWYAAQRWLAPRTGPDLVGNVLILNFDPRASQDEWTKALLASTELSTIEYMSATRPTLQPDDISHLARFKAMKQLCVNDVRAVPDLTPLAELKQLDKFGLNHCSGVTAEKLRALRDLPQLKLIDLCCSDANDAVACELAQFPALEELHAEFSGITHNGLLELGKSKSLRIVHIHGGQAAQGIAAQVKNVTFDVK